jgi:hypothetical protein
MNGRALLKVKLRKTLRYIIGSLPLVGIIIANFLTVSARAHQFLVLMTLVWFQAFIFYEVFARK